MSKSAEDVVITGIGCIGPIGGDRDTFWQGLLAGERGVRVLTDDDFHGIPLPQSENFPLVGAPARLNTASEHAEPVVDLIKQAADEAFCQAGLHEAGIESNRAGCVIGTSKGGLVAFAHEFLHGREGMTSASSWCAFPPHAASSAVAARFRLGGPCLAPVAACATGLISVLRGCELIRDGLCDIVLAGSGDASLHPAVLASFRRMGVLATHVEDPAAACRPFNADRDGFAVGEGAAVFVLERRHHAERRDVHGFATVRGGAVLSDPSGMTNIDPRGETIARAIRDLMSRSAISSSEIGHVNLHGTATKSNDVAEATALRRIFGQRLDQLPCVALKGAIGHQLGAAGAVELAAMALAVHEGKLPPTINLTDPDPACRLQLRQEVEFVSGCGLKISLGFGGHVAVACLGPA